MTETAGGAAIRVAALYQFTRFDDPAGVQAGLGEVCRASGIRGTLLVAGEGINGTIAGASGAIERVLEHIRSLPGCAALRVAESSAEAMPFHRMKVRLKREIVTMGQPDIDGAASADAYVSPAEWNALIAEPGTIVIDTRNDYEVAVGTFPGAINPETASFRDFPGWFRAHRDDLLAGDAPPKVAMFCTGGIRCEKAVAFLKAEGVEDVVHLKGGILNYLETVPAEDSRWDGECFVFDERVAVGHGLSAGTHELCRACRMPVSPEQRQSPEYREGISCPHCHDARDDRQRMGYAERHRQVLLAERRGEQHVGARLDD
jgi:UPF0176 protein